MKVFKIVKNICEFFFATSGNCSINKNWTGNLPLLSFWTVSAMQALLPVPARTIYKKDQESLSAARTYRFLPSMGLFLVRRQCADTGLLHPVPHLSPEWSKYKNL